MGAGSSDIAKVMGAIVSRTREVLAIEAELGIAGIEAIERTTSKLDLHDITAIAGMGGSVGLLVAFSFQRGLLDVLYRSVTSTFTVPEDEVDLYVRETAAEIVNTILGLCTSDLQTPNQAITLSPPVIIDEARCIQRPNDAVFASMRIVTVHGAVDVGLVGPRELFDAKINYLH
jgi:CheY-specific phosphatase CheX